MDFDTIIDYSYVSYSFIDSPSVFCVTGIRSAQVFTSIIFESEDAL